MEYVLTDRQFWEIIAAIAGFMILISTYADRRRGKRTNIEAVGFMPWTAITVFSVMAALLAMALAIKSV